MQAILTKYLSPTNTKGARITATAARGRAVFSWDHSLSPEANHVRAAEKLTARFAGEDFTTYGTNPAENPWSRHFATGALPSGDFAHVFLSR